MKQNEIYTTHETIMKRVDFFGLSLDLTRRCQVQDLRQKRSSSRNGIVGIRAQLKAQLCTALEYYRYSQACHKPENLEFARSLSVCWKIIILNRDGVFH